MQHSNHLHVPPCFTLFLGTTAGSLQADGFTYTWQVDFNNLLPDRHQYKSYRVEHTMNSGVADVSNSAANTVEVGGLVAVSGLHLAASTGIGSALYVNAWQCEQGPWTDNGIVSASLKAPPRQFMVYSPTDAGGPTAISIVLVDHTGAKVATAISGTNVPATHILTFTPVREW
jgi:hypothetical protein